MKPKEMILGKWYVYDECRFYKVFSIRDNNEGIEYKERCYPEDGRMYALKHNTITNSDYWKYAKEATQEQLDKFLPLDHPDRSKIEYSIYH